MSTIAAMDYSFESHQEAAAHFQGDIIRILFEIRGIDANESRLSPPPLSISNAITYYADVLRMDHEQDAVALDTLHSKVTTSPSYGGLDITIAAIPSHAQYTELLFQTEAHLESVNSRLKAPNFLQVSTSPPSPNTQPMTLAQKIVLQHALSGIPPDSTSLSAGDVIRTGIDWIIASELSWHGMSQTYSALGSPGIWRNDRFWIAGDHVVHPSLTSDPKIKTYIETAEKAKRDFRLTDYQGMNYTIMHTEFVRERALPGMLVIGSDSHTCSAGAVGCLAIGLGAADVMMTLALGETWFKVPESVLITLSGRPAFGISGKDVILHILGELKRNTVAAERIVEFDGEGCKFLSSDARFTICNMCTEFGAITGIFVPDEVTQSLVEGRKRRVDREGAVYFRPDDRAPYAQRCEIDLSAVRHTIAVYPNPDDVVPVTKKAGIKLDGVFIGACTTTEEELVLGALVLAVGLEKRLPLAKGKRHYVPGSLPIVEKLRELDLLEVYEAAGFTRGPPGCSLCVGLSAEKASEGETWLSSQNRNFKNRMGKGSFGHLSSAVVCAASAFSMSITDPASFLQDLDTDFFERYKGISDEGPQPVMYSHPRPSFDQAAHSQSSDAAIHSEISKQPTGAEQAPEIVKSKIITLGDFVDTDALSPGFTLTSCTTDEEFGEHVLCHTYPEFREKVKAGQEVVVGGHAFGVGSSRESAVSALKGAGVQAVIAKSFAFIFGRNLPSLGLLGIVMDDEDFHAAAQDEAEIAIDLERRCIEIGSKEFAFELSEMEYRLTMDMGITQAYSKYGKAIWERLTRDGREEPRPSRHNEQPSVDQRLEW